MKNSTSIPDGTQVVMITDLKRILPLDTSPHHLNQRVNLVLCETSPESDFRKFEFRTSSEWLPWPFCV
jgi:hypothetical protein